MTTIVRVDRFPNEGSPQVIAGDPQLGDIVRITTNTGAVIYERYTPPAPPPAPGPIVLSATAFQDVCEAALGGNGVGRTRFGKVIRDMSASADDEVLSVFKRYDKSQTFERGKASALFTLLVSKSILTAQERTAILAAWPNQ